MFETLLNEHSANNRAMSLSHGRRDFAYRNQSLTHLGDLRLSMGEGKHVTLAEKERTRRRWNFCDYTSNNKPLSDPPLTRRACVRTHGGQRDVATVCMRQG